MELEDLNAQLAAAEGTAKRSTGSSHDTLAIVMAIGAVGRAVVEELKAMNDMIGMDPPRHD